MFCKIVTVLKTLLTISLAGFFACAPQNGRYGKRDIPDAKENLKEANQEVHQYQGPEYLIGITTFSNDTPSGILGIGEFATIVLRKTVINERMKPLLLSREEKNTIDTLIEVNSSGIVASPAKDIGLTGGIDFLFTGAVTSYSEKNHRSRKGAKFDYTKVSTIDLRITMVDVLVGKIFASETIKGEFIEKSGIDKKYFLSTRKDRIKEALRDAWDKGMKIFVKKLLDRPFLGVLQVVREKTVLFIGAPISRLKKGSKLAIYRRAGDVLDPKTGKTVHVGEHKAGEITVKVDINENPVEAEITEGKDFIYGDFVRIFDND